jgi:hypothetical protein
MQRDDGRHADAFAHLDQVARQANPVVHMHELGLTLSQELLEARLDFRMPHLHVVIEEQVVSLQAMHDQPLDLALGQGHLSSCMLRPAEYLDGQTARALPLR